MIEGCTQENEGLPFIEGFVLLSIFAAVSLAIDFTVLADEVGISAHCGLVAGVVNQLAYSLKYHKKMGS